MDEADQVCDRVGIIDRGKLLVIDSTENLKNSIGQLKKAILIYYHLDTQSEVM